MPAFLRPKPGPRCDNEKLILGHLPLGSLFEQVSAAAGYNVTMVDIKDEFLAKSQETIQKNVGRGFKKAIEKGTMTEADAKAKTEEIMSRLTKTTVA